MERPLLAPRWVAGHVTVALVVTLFVGLGLWQLSRHHDQNAFNQRLQERLAAEPSQLSSLQGEPEELEFLTVSTMGDLLWQEELRRGPRSRGGVQGYDSIVPLATDNGILLVNRGFVSDSSVERPAAERVTVVGVLRESEGGRRFGPRNPSEGVLDDIGSVDIDRLQSQFDEPLYPLYLDLSDSVPDIGAEELPPSPTLSRRQNLPYAIQWWTFALIGVVGWVIYLRKQVLSQPGRY